METLTLITESAPAPVKKGGRWRVTIARPGKGSSGTYSEQTLRETGPLAFPPGTKSFFNHDTKRDVRDMVGTFPDGAFWNEEEGELQADLEPFPRFAPVLEEAGTAIEASIHAKGEKDAAGNVRKLVFDRANTVDLVSFAGLEGSGLKFQLESLFAAAAAAEQSDADASAQKPKEEGEHMIEEKVAELASTVEKLTAAFESFVEESRTKVKGEADAEAVAAAAQAQVAEALATYQEKVAKIEAAELLPTQVESLKARALAGEDIEEALTEATTFVTEARAALAPAASGRAGGKMVVVTESATPSGANIRIGRWSKS